ncbi:MAG: hypothetical protein KBA81_06920 [Rhabdochlamydiaceae bacterium]|nr:hypothetical protein [Rhabdochlamydiaceae bacterium]
MTPTELLVKTWIKYCEAHQIDNLSCGMATRKLVEMIEEHMSQKAEINDTSKEHVARNDISEQRLGEYRAGHYSSDMISAMVKEAFKRGMDKVLSRVPRSDEITEESDAHYVTLEGRMIYFDKAFRHGVDFVIEKLKEPT